MIGPNPIARRICHAVLAACLRNEAFLHSVEHLNDGALVATPIAATAAQFSLLRRKFPYDASKTACNQVHRPTQNLLLLSRVRGSAEYGMAVDPPIPLLSPAIATKRAERLPHADRARRLRRCAKVHPDCVHAKPPPAQWHDRKTVETSHCR